MTSIVKIYHNPACSKSRKVLELIRNAGQEPVVIEYLKAPPTKQELCEIIQGSGLTVREVLRTNEEQYKILRLDEPQWTDEELTNFMLEYPVLINRPFVITENGVRLCRPEEKLYEILPSS